MDNRRKSLRIPIVSIAQVINQDRELSARILVRDLSRTGLGGYINVPCKRGDHFLISLRLNTQDNQTVEGLLTGEVSWATEIEASEKYAFGLRFCEMEIQHTRLYAYLISLEKNYLKELEEIYELPPSL